MTTDKISVAIGRLTASELRQLELASRSNNHGGDPITEPLLTKVVKLGLAYGSSGRLKQEVIRNLLEGDKPLMVG